MSVVICPVCDKPLSRQKNTYICENNHSFDISKYGYVNLLQSQKSFKKRHGDDKMMIDARRSFLEKGYYKPLCDEVVNTVKKYYCGESIIDTGCGECYYTQSVFSALGGNASITAVDISKDAMRYAAKRRCASDYVIASVFNLPIADDSANMLINMFAPLCESEYRRVLKTGGIMIRVFPLEDHLIQMKKIIYDEVYLNRISTLKVDGFELISTEKTRFTIHTDNKEDILNLFKMTPYYYKTSAEGQKRIDELDCLTTDAAFITAVYKKEAIL